MTDNANLAGYVEGYADCLLDLEASSDAILIRRNAEGNWPGELKLIARKWAVGFYEERGFLAEDLFDALSESLKGAE